MNTEAVSRACWLELCEVDVSRLAKWLEGATWPQARKNLPQRIKVPPEAFEIVNQILGVFDNPVEAIREYACFGRLLPGQAHDYHLDSQKPEWITRVHVPVITNPDAWFMWEPEGKKVHFEVGKAYSFNTLINHAFANEGQSERVHLMFDVVRA